MKDKSNQYCTTLYV